MDKFVVRAVVCFLGVAVLLGLGGIIWLIASDPSSADAALLAIVAGPTGTALGALGSLLVRVGGSDGGSPTPVTIVDDSALTVEDPGAV